jgi:hypothetical protein
MYIKIVNEIPISHSIDQLRYENPNISFPNNISDEILKNFNMYPYVIAEYPIINDKTQKIEEGEIVYHNNMWIKTWKIIDKNEEEILNWIENKSLDAKTKRNILLSETDFYALSDNILAPDMATYRQSLRDITQQDGFPENIIWPVKPV